MKKVYYLVLFVLFCNLVSAQIVGTWKLANRPGTLAVGPTETDFSWWSSTFDDTLSRNCLFDDSLKFDELGVVTHYMDELTWMEEWQGLPSPQCGFPSPPHNGWGFTGQDPFTYAYDNVAGTITMIGYGAHLGLAKVVNGAELTESSQAPETIIYNIAFSNNNNTFTATIYNGNGYWKFVYDRIDAPAVTPPNVTFRVDMRDFSGTIVSGVYVSGTFNNWCGDCIPMTNIGNNIYEVITPLFDGPIQYKFVVDNWAASEAFTSVLPCIDNVEDGFFNRFYNVVGDAVLPTVCYNSCDACPSLSVNELSSEIKVKIQPNPADDLVTIHTNTVSEVIELFDVSGTKVLDVKASSSNMTEINISSIQAGTYIVRVLTNHGLFTERLIIK